MRTSHTQYTIMVEFMERNGDLSKPSGGPRGRHFIQMKWKELVEKLNSEGTGDSRSEEKWRKVWSDLKNNTKKKLAKINRAASRTGGGPALKLSLTDLENRVIQIIGVQAAVGMVVEEAGFSQSSDVVITVPPHTPEVNPEAQMFSLAEVEPTDEDWNAPGTSSQATVVPPQKKIETSTIVEDVKYAWKAPPQKKKKNTIANLFLESDMRAREYAREADRANERLETERLRIQDFDIRERVRQRDLELQLQAQWLQLMKEMLDIIKKYFSKE